MDWGVRLAGVDRGEHVISGTLASGAVSYEIVRRAAAVV
jgi:hypothetical protein